MGDDYLPPFPADGFSFDDTQLQVMLDLQPELEDGAYAN